MYDIMSLTVQINVALRVRICQKFGSKRVKSENKQNDLHFFNREGEVQLILSKKQKYLHVLLVLQPFLYLDINVKLNWYILFSTPVC